MLRSMRREWEMSFAEGADAALNMLKSAPFDVVVTDMRMPGKDGAQLLQEVMELYPHMVRLILSGHSDQEMAMRSVGPAHQYLSKPCDSEALKQTISQACRLRDTLAEENLRQLVSRLKGLPSLPSLYLKLVDEIQKPNVTTAHIGEIIAQDIGMTAKILQLVNSAFFGLSRRVTNPEDAVGFIGLERIKAMVLSIHVFSEFNASTEAGFPAEQFWSHSLAVGKLADQIAKSVQNASSSETFTAGMLHDVGTLVLASNLPEQYQAARDLMKSENLTTTEAERRVFKATHSEIGAYLLGLWGLPSSLIEAVAFHNNPSQCLSQGFTTLSAIHIADGLLHRHSTAPFGEGTKLDEEYIAKL
ncbi:MAG TPA: response regulator, partial [Blastocatellia bacterium]|nr:response regulator [Blastocatellia bacterium]